METLTEMLRERGYPVLMERPVVRIAHDGTKVTHLVTRGAKGEQKFEGKSVV